jgi:CPA1 family monovalent cation:H+ antiporter
MGIEDVAGIYIELLLVAILIAVISNRFSGLPYTIALVIVGLVVGVTRIVPGPEQLGFSRELIFFVFLPPLLFQGALHLEFNRLLKHFWPIFTFAIVGVAVSTAVIGGVFSLVGGMTSVLVALLFGSMISPTDPVSVLALFKKAGVSADLKHVVEGESLFNDGTSIVLFTIILDMIVKGGEASVGGAALAFVKVSGGGLILGIGLGYVAWLFLKQFDDPVLETTACLVLAMGSFYLAEKLHLSGVIATVAAGLLIGNHGRRLSMSPKVTQMVEGTFEVTDFLVNSVLFLMIGLEMQVVGMDEWVEYLPLVGAGILGLLLARALVVYPFWHLLNLTGTKRPGKWAHVLFWGGLRGSIPIALLLGIMRDSRFPEEYKKPLLVAGFGVVLFSLVVQGLTFMPLLKLLGLTGAKGEDEEQPGDEVAA